MSELHVFHDDYEWVIAASAADAEAVTEEAGAGPGDIAADERWEQLDDAKPLKMWCDASGEICEIGDGALVERTCAEWIALKGRCYLGSTEA